MFQKQPSETCNFIKKGNLAQAFSCEFCEISKNIFCYRTPPACNFIKKESLAQVFSCEFCKVSKNTFCYRTPPTAASVYCRKKVFGWWWVVADGGGW